MKLLTKKISIKTFLKLIIVRLLYTFLTIRILSGLWYSGTGGYGISYSIEKDIVSFIFLIINTVFFCMFNIEGTFKKTVITVLTIIYFIPLNASAAINDMPYGFIFLTNIYYFFIIFIFSIQRKSSKTLNDINNRELIQKSITETRVKYIFIIICLFFIVYKISYNGFSFNLSLYSDNVYSNREKYSLYSNGIKGSFFAYFLTLLSGLCLYIAPVYLYFSLRDKSICGFVISLLTVISEFSISSGKTVIFFTIIVFLVYFTYKKRSIEKMNSLFITAILLLLVICFYESLIIRVGSIYSFFVRRTMYMPAWLNGMYYDFFSRNPKLHWSQNVFFLQKIIPNVYVKGPLDLISQEYFNGTMVSPNTGMFAEVYMHWGAIGFLLYGIIYYCVFNFANKVFERYGKGVSIIVALNVALQFANVPITRTDTVMSFGAFTILLWWLQKKHGSKSCLKSYFFAV